MKLSSLPVISTRVLLRLTPHLLCRSTPISDITFPTSTETITAVRFNLSEASVLASIGSDRTFTLYDIRTGKAERRVVMQVSAAILSIWEYIY